MAKGSNRERYFDTLPPEAISDELAPVIAELGLEANCRQLAMEGWTVIEAAASDEFNGKLRARILELAEGTGGANMLLAKDPLFVEAVLNPRLMAMAEFSVGRGFLLSQVAASVRPKGAPVIGLHADNNWVPAPFPAHNLLLTACWACDGYTEAGGATLIIPGSNTLHRHPNENETAAQDGAVAVECPPGSVVLWDGNLWHSNYPRSIDGERVALFTLPGVQPRAPRPPPPPAADSPAVDSNEPPPISQIAPRVTVSASDRASRNRADDDWNVRVPLWRAHSMHECCACAGYRRRGQALHPTLVMNVVLALDTVDEVRPPTLIVMIMHYAI